MYSALYGFNEKPFALLSDSRLFYLGDTHRGILDILQRAVQQHESLCVLTGEVGVGKTTLAHYMLGLMGSKDTLGFITTANFPADEVIKNILAAFHQPTTGNEQQLGHLLSNFIAVEKSKNNHPVLIIDDAHKLSIEAFNVLDSFIMESEEKDLSITTILLGEPPLCEMLGKNELESLRQRISSENTLGTLGQDETIAYINCRAALAGANPGLFETAASVAVYNHTSGLPRSINLLCDSALVYGYVAESETITEKLVNSVVDDKKRGRLFPALTKAEEIAKERAEKDKEIAGLRSAEAAKQEAEEDRLKEEARLKAEQIAAKQRAGNEARHEEDEKEKSKSEERLARLKSAQEAEKKKAREESLRKSEEEARLNAEQKEKQKTEKEAKVKEDERTSPNASNSLQGKQAIKKSGDKSNLKPIIAVTASIIIMMGIVMFSSNNEKPSVPEVATENIKPYEDKQKEQKLKAQAEERARADALKIKQEEEARKKAVKEAERKMAEEETIKKAAIKAERERKAKAARLKKERATAAEKAKQAELARKKKEEEALARKKSEQELAKKKAEQEAEQQKPEVSESEAQLQRSEELARRAELEAKQKEDARNKRIQEIQWALAKKKAEQEAVQEKIEVSEDEAQQQRSEELARRAADLEAKQKEDARKKRIRELQQAEEDAVDAFE